MNVLIYVPPPPPPGLGVAVSRHLPIGALVIGSYAKHAGHNVKIIDGDAAESLTDAVHDGFVPDVLGISLITMYGILAVDGIRDFISEVQKLADPVVVFGGAGASVLSEILLNEKLAHYVVIGPGEDIFVELLSALEAGRAVSGIPGVAYLDAAGSCVQALRANCGGEFGMSLPLDYSLMDITPYIIVDMPDKTKKKSLAVYTSRGCKYRCTFCFNEAFFACSYQPRPVSVIISEMKVLVEQYGITHFTIMDECFGAGKAWLYELCNAMLAELPPVTWSCMHHGGVRTREDYELMYKAGCRKAFIGIESADPQMNRKIRKGLDLTRIPAEIDLMHELGMRATLSFIVGFPDETREQLLRSCEFMLSSKADSFYISEFYLIPDTKMFEELASAGRVTMPKTLAEVQAYLSPGRHPNYSNIPEREINVVLGFINLAWRVALLFENGKLFSNLRTYIILQSGGDVRFFFSSILFFLKCSWHVAAHPLIRKRYGLWAWNFKRYSPPDGKRLPPGSY